MEEILASIRKIISEDSTEASAAPAPVQAPTVFDAPPPAAPAPTPFAAALASAAAPEPKEDEPEEVLDLTQEIPAPVPEPVQTAPAPAPKAEDEVVFQPAEEPAPAPSTTSDIFSDKTRKALDDAFAKLDEVPVPEPAAPKFMPKPAAVEGNSVEAVFERAVREAVGPHIDQWMSGQKDDLLAAMKPLIRDWMDDHFPALLEGAVREEVARVLKARGQR
jgi:cell pole-organizing protein PopZ